MSKHSSFRSAARSCLVTLCVGMCVGAEPERATDVLVVGGTASGVAAAVTAARSGVRVTLVEPTDRLGGMIGNGVSKTDIGMRETSSGLFEEFRLSVRRHYNGVPEAEDGFKYEPRVANALIHALVDAERNITLLKNTRIVDVVKSADNRVLGAVVQTSSGERRTLRARVTIDASDEGDLAAWAGAQYRVGREARSAAEPHAGVIYLDRGGINPRDTSIPHRYKILLPESSGRADAATQAYSFLMTLKDYGTSSPEARHVLKQPPPSYDPSIFRHVTPWEKTWAMFSGRIPGNKHEVNQYPYGVEIPGGNEGYIEGDAATRARIVEAHRNRALAYLYHLQHVEKKWNLGLPDDEYTANGGFPVQLYVRQGRRIIGGHILSEADVNPFIAGDGVRPPRFADAIATGTFALDVHPISEKSSPSRSDNGEGELFLPEVTAPFQVPYRCLVPEGVSGLLVSQAISSTHMGYQAVRLEGVRMSMGMAAGVAASMAIRTGQPLDRIDAQALQDELLRRRSLLYVYRDVPPSSPEFFAVQKLSLAGALDGFDDYTFRPSAPLTRAAAATMVVKGLEVPVSVTALHFDDVPRRHPAVRYVETLYDRDVTKVWVAGDGRVFAPEQHVTANEFEAVLAALQGVPPTPAGNAVLTRGEAAVLLWKAVQNRSKQ